MSIRERTDASAPATSLEVCSRLVEALKLALVGPGAGHALAEERLHRREQEEALALPLARRGPRRGAGASPGAQRRAREGGGPLRRRGVEEGAGQGREEARGGGVGGSVLMSEPTLE